jgi:hypothetical protein
MGIHRIIRKIFIYAAVFALLVALYLGAAALVARLFEGLPGYRLVFSTAAAAIIFSFGFQPLRQRIQAFMDARFFRQYADREEKLYELSREVITHMTPESMAEALMRVLADALHPQGKALYLRARDGDGFVRVSADSAALPERMGEKNELARYFMDHPQPFVQDLASDFGSPRSTRFNEKREDVR